MIILIIIFTVFILYFLIKRIKKRNQTKIAPRKISQTITTSDGRFTLLGNTDHFTICKDENVSFNVLNGEIVSVKTKDGKTYRYEG